VHFREEWGVKREAWEAKCQITEPWRLSLCPPYNISSASSTVKCFVILSTILLKCTCFPQTLWVVLESNPGSHRHHCHDHHVQHFNRTVAYTLRLIGLFCSPPSSTFPLCLLSRMNPSRKSAKQAECCTFFAPLVQTAFVSTLSNITFGWTCMSLLHWQHSQWAIKDGIKTKMKFFVWMISMSIKFKCHQYESAQLKNKQIRWKSFFSWKTNQKYWWLILHWITFVQSNVL